MASIRCRFAPSPTGHLHIGGARTALFNWLFARHQGGEFFLRIEDTDPERSQPEFTQGILEGLSWLGLDGDGELLYQSQRMALYRRYQEQLLERGQAYWCSCTPAELEEMRAAALKSGGKPRYNGRCRDRREHPPDRPQVLRFKSISQGQTVVLDLVQGRVVFENNELDDLVLVRGDGVPTYNFCAVVDDHEMGITHIIRGADHLSNTPRQIQIYQALGLEPPRFAHHPLILGEDRSKMSKRHGATSLLAYRDQGYLPEAMMNFLVRIGWSHGDQEIFSRDELIRLFELKDLASSPGVWNPEKLLWTNGYYIRERSVEELARLALPFFLAKGLSAEPDDYLGRVVADLRERAKTLAEFAERGAFYYADEIGYEEKAAKKFLTPRTAVQLEKVLARLSSLAEWTPASLEAGFQEMLAASGDKLGTYAQPVRVAVTGSTQSPGLFEVLATLGQDRVVARLRRAIAFARAGSRA
ncbi:MAG: glutamate--tRNA ligase [Deltaproteobacteria bacterium RBG_13_61_14]|nr:MAG: glutamate--tRNA ligase [Deltaproteobacteria bacterium RBG_13_61_14]